MFSRYNRTSHSILDGNTAADPIALHGILRRPVNPLEPRLWKQKKVEGIR